MLFDVLAMLQTAPALGPLAQIGSHLGEGLSLGLVLVAKHFLFDRRSAAAQTDALTRKVEEAQRSNEQRFDGIDRNITKLFAHVIGADGQNGLRGDVRRVESKMDEFEQRERERLSRAVGTIDRRREV